MAKYLDLPGTASHWATTPDHASFTPTTSHRIDIRLNLPDYSASSIQALLSQYGTSGGSKHWFFRLEIDADLHWLNNETAELQRSTTVSSLTDNTTGWLRVDITYGAGDGVVTFYQAADSTTEVIGDLTYAQISTHTGLTQTAVTTTQQLGMGARAATGASNMVIGRMYQARMQVDGVTVAHFNGADFNLGDSDTATAADTTGKTWTINGTGSQIRDDAVTTRGDLILLGVGG